MLRFSVRKPCLGIEITDAAIRLAVVSGCGAKLSAHFMKSAELPPGVVNETYASPNITDFDSMSSALRDCLAGAPKGVRRAALSLPDGVFRVQALDFDELPRKTADRERLIRWRLEKGAAFDVADTVMRYQFLERRDKGYTVLSCVAKQSVIAQYEALLVGFGLEPWLVGPASFHTQNFYASYCEKKSAVSGFARISGDSFATIIREAKGVRFYRYKDVKRGSADEVRDRLMREIDDSLHFYTHMNHSSQQQEIRDLYLAGEHALSTELAERLRTETSLNVEILAPSLVVASGENIQPEMAAALGAGSSL